MFIFTNQYESTKLIHTAGWPIYNMYLLYNILCVTHTNLLVKESAMEKQNMMPPSKQSIEPAQPIKRAAPSSNLQTKPIV